MEKQMSEFCKDCLIKQERIEELERAVREFVYTPHFNHGAYDKLIKLVGGDNDD